MQNLLVCIQEHKVEQLKVQLKMEGEYGGSIGYKYSK